jgi:hypothetical protein
VVNLLIYQTDLQTVDTSAISSGSSFQLKCWYHMSITWFEQMAANRRVLLHWRLVTCYSYQWCRIGYSSKVLKSCQMSKKTIALLLFICSNTCNLWFHIFVKLCSYSYMDHVNCVKKWVSFLVFILDLLFRILGLGWVRVDLEPVRFQIHSESETF